METLAECLRLRMQGIEESLIKYIRDKPPSVSTEIIMGRVRYDVGRINELENTIQHIEGLLNKGA